MFGYITINQDELKIKDYRKYHAYYCGVCRSLRQLYGISGQMTLTYDMTFLAILLSALYEDETPVCRHHCIVHPFSKHETITNAYTDYAAAMNVMLSYYKLKDDWKDEKRIKSNAFAALLKKSFKKVCSQYPKQAEAVRTYIQKQQKMESDKEQDIDIVSGCTGEMLGTLFVMREDVWKQDLYRMGFFMGKYIYIMDALDDFEKDQKKSSYNPFLLQGQSDGAQLEEQCRVLLTIVAAECSKAFERLPVLQDAEILRNILYSGVWNKFDLIRNRRNQKKGNKER